MELGVGLGLELVRLRPTASRHWLVHFSVTAPAAPLKYAWLG